MPSVANTTGGAATFTGAHSGRRPADRVGVLELVVFVSTINVYRWNGGADSAALGAMSQSATVASTAGMVTVT